MCALLLTTQRALDLLQHEELLLICKELDRYNVDIAALSETRLADDGQMQEIASSYTIFWKGRTSRERREAGVGFAIRTNIVSKFHELL